MSQPAWLNGGQRRPLGAIVEANRAAGLRTLVCHPCTVTAGVPADSGGFAYVTGPEVRIQDFASTVRCPLCENWMDSAEAAKVVTDTEGTTIFVGYTRSDEAAVRDLVERLRQTHGLTVETIAAELEQAAPWLDWLAAWLRQHAGRITAELLLVVLGVILGQMFSEDAVTPTELERILLEHQPADPGNHDRHDLRRSPAFRPENESK